MRPCSSRAGSITRCSAALRRLEAAVEEASDQPGGDVYLYAVRDEQAYLQTDDDEKPVFVHPRLILPSSNAGSAGSPTSRCRPSSAPSTQSGTPTTSPTRRRSSSATSALRSSRSNWPR